MVGPCLLLLLVLFPLSLFGKLSFVSLLCLNTLLIGTVGSAKPLVNDLDLTVSNQTHTLYSLTSTLTGSFRSDTKNTVEMIVIHNPMPNTAYNVTVSYSKAAGGAVSKTQPYALVVTGEISEYQYSDKSDMVASGLSQKAKIAVGVASGCALFLTLCVCWLVYCTSTRKRKIKEHFERALTPPPSSKERVKKYSSPKESRPPSAV
jgi:hypothetical protein